jgi:hypothetical protein
MRYVRTDVDFVSVHVMSVGFWACFRWCPGVVCWCTAAGCHNSSSCAAGHVVCAASKAATTLLCQTVRMLRKLCLLLTD